jgi:Zn-dependent protease with chaperone function
MRYRAWWLLLSLACAPAWCEVDIVDVLRRSQDQRLEAQQPGDEHSAQAAAVRQSFERLLQALQPAPVVELRVTTGPAIAETLHGHIIIANERLGAMPESVRLFILAHELGHVALQHWRQTAEVYQKWIPGAVTPEHTNPVAALLGREASVLAHQHEFAADAYAAQLLQAVDGADADLLAVFRHLGSTPDTATHPGTRKRVASLRALHLASSR